jgi:hypothetical protein
LSAILAVIQHTKRPPIFGDSCRDPAYQKTSYFRRFLS